MSGAGVQLTSTIASLKQLAIPSGSSATLVEGYYALNDGGGGTFFWDATSSAADDGGSVIIPASMPATGRWVREQSDTVSILQFGAQLNSAVDDTQAIQNAINYLPPGGGTVTFPARPTYLAGTLSIGNGTGPGSYSTKQGVRLKGVGVGWNPGNGPANNGATLVFSPTSGYAMNLNGQLSGFSIEDIAIVSSATTGTASGINLNGLEFGYFRNLTISEFLGSGIALTQCYKCIFENTFIFLGNGTSANGVNWNTGATSGNGSFNNTWTNLRVGLTNTSQTALIFGAVDSEFLFNVDIQGIAGQVGGAITFYYGNASGNSFPQNVSIFGVDPYQHYIGSAGTPAANIEANRLWNFSTVNGASVPSGVPNLVVINS